MLTIQNVDCIHFILQSSDTLVRNETVEKELEPRKTCSRKRDVNQNNAMAVGQNYRDFFFFFPRRGEAHILLAVPDRNVIAVQETEQQLRSFNKNVSFIMFKVGRAPKHPQGVPENIIQR